MKNDWACLITAIIAIVLIVVCAELDEKQYSRYGFYNGASRTAEERWKIKREEIRAAGGPAKYYKNRSPLKLPSERENMYKFILCVWFAGFMCGSLAGITIYGIKDGK